MSGWVVEHAPTAIRAARIEGEAIVEALIALQVPGRATLGAVVEARWASPQRINAGELVAAAVLEAADGTQLYLPAPPAGSGPGARLWVEVVREAVWTPRGAKLAKVRVANLTRRSHVEAPETAKNGVPCWRSRVGDRDGDDAPSASAPERSGAVLSPYAADTLEAAGWSALIEEAETGLVERGPVRLLIDVTEAMTLIDVDGALPAERLAVAGAALAAQTIRRMDIGGNIGIDLPTVAGAARKAAADAFDTAMAGALAGPGERTAVNGFGFLQVVRPLLRPSLLAIMRSPHAQAERERRVWRHDYDAYLTHHAR